MATAPVGLPLVNASTGPATASTVSTAQQAASIQASLCQNGVSNAACQNAVQSLPAGATQLAYAAALPGATGTATQQVTGTAAAPPPTTVVTLTGESLPDAPRNLLIQILQEAGISSARVSSGPRNAHEQAVVMYENLQSQSLADQKELYMQPGKQVIAVYEANAGKSKAEVIAAMEAKINELGPSTVSKHCDNSYYAFDVGPPSIQGHEKAFVDAVKAHMPPITKFLVPPADPGYHIQIPRSSLDAN